MSYLTTTDERGVVYAGAAPGQLDVGDTIYSTDVGTLARGVPAYGTLGGLYVYTADTDVYALGTLTPGSYRINVSDTVWDYGKTYYGGQDTTNVSSWQLLDDSGKVWATHYGTLYSTTLTTEPSDQGVNWFVAIHGNWSGSAQYSVSYNTTNPPSQDSSTEDPIVPTIDTGTYDYGTYDPAYYEQFYYWTPENFIYNSVDTSGIESSEQTDVSAPENSPATFVNTALSPAPHVVGNEITASFSFSDDDGTQSSVLDYEWFRYDGTTYSSIASGSDSYEIQQSDLGYQLAVAVSFVDDRGNLEVSDKYGHWQDVEAPSLFEFTPIILLTDTAEALPSNKVLAEGEALNLTIMSNAMDRVSSVTASLSGLETADVKFSSLGQQAPGLMIRESDAGFLFITIDLIADKLTEGSETLELDVEYLLNDGSSYSFYQQFSVTDESVAESDPSVVSSRIVHTDFSEGSDGYQVATLIGAAFGADYLDSYFGAGMSLMSSGTNMSQLAELIVETGLVEESAGGTYEEWVAHVYFNVTGTRADALTKGLFASQLELGEVSKAELLVTASSVDSLKDQIDLIGLKNSGIEYIDF